MAGKTPFITATDARDAYEESRKWYRVYDEPLTEFERIQRNRPSEKIDPSLPKVTDGTLAAINQEDPKRIIQQIPTGLLSSKDHPEFAPMGNYLITNKLIPLSHVMGSEIQKSWSLISKAGTTGHQSTYCYLTVCNGEIYVEWILPYEKDILGEKGKTFIPDSKVRFMRSWYQKRDLQAIINKEKGLMSTRKGYTSDWNLPLVSQFMNEGGSAKAAEYQTPAEREKGGDTGGFEVIHVFQEGKEAEFYSFAPRFKDGQSLRTKVNPDPRGKMPFDDMYWNIDHSNPRGRGQIELSGGIQNLMDQQLQGFSFNSVYMQQPALIIGGNVNKATLKIKPNAIWDKGSNPQNSIERDAIDNESIRNFVPNMQYLQSKIYNLNSSQDHSIGAGQGDVNQSKTQAGVKAAEAKLGASDNYIRKQFEEAWGNMTETRLNIYLSEMTGTATMQLEGDDLKTIQKSDSAKYLDKKGVLTIPYKEIEKVAFSFSVDASSSEVKEDADNAEKLTEVLKLVQTSQNPQIQQKETQILKLLVDEIGAEGTDDLFPELTQKDQNGMPIDAAQAQQGAPAIDPQMIQQMVEQTVQQAMKAQQKPLHEALNMKFETLPKDVQDAIIQQVFGITPQAPSQVDIQNQQKQQEIDLKAQDQQNQTVLAADKQAHDTQLAVAKHVHDTAQAHFQNTQADRSSTLSEVQAALSQRNTEEQNKLAAKQPKPAAGAKA
jgi:hypothetical protein